MASRATMVHTLVEAGPSLYKPFFDYMHRELKSAENRMLFSRTIEKLFPRTFKMTDIDSVIFRRQFDRLSRFRGEEPVAAFELKRKSWAAAQDAWLNGELEVNGYQFIRIRRVARMLRIPYYYFIQVGDKFVLFNVLQVKPSFEKRHEGTQAEDFYAIIPHDQVIISNSLEDLRTDLKFLLEGR